MTNSQSSTIQLQQISINRIPWVSFEYIGGVSHHQLLCLLVQRSQKRGRVKEKASVSSSSSNIAFRSALLLLLIGVDAEKKPCL